MSATIALAGQPNCGKSTLFNALAGYRAATGNFPGTSVSYTTGSATLGGEEVRLVDLPGLYALSAQDAAERVAQDYLLSGSADALIVVLDATLLGRGLALALDLLAIGLPTVVAVNLADEAKLRGLEVDLGALERILGVPVLATVATRKEGVAALGEQAILALRAGRTPVAPAFLSPELESAVAELAAAVPALVTASVRATARFLALRLLDGDVALAAALGEGAPGLVAQAALVRARLSLPKPLSERLMAERHAAARVLAAAATRNPAKAVGPTRRERLDVWLLHPIVGPIIALFAFASLFLAAFVAGDALASLISVPFDAVAKELAPHAATSFWWAVAKGAWDGLAGGAGIVLPYLLPLVLLLSFYEDLGYLPRAAYLVDGLLTRVGLHGKSVVPLVLGYGCNVPALMGTRILESPRDRLVTAMLVPFIPCSARTVVILALIGATLGPWWALGMYGLNLLIVGLVGRILGSLARRKDRGRSLGIVMEMPPLRIPPPRAVLRKVWFRSYECLALAWPVLLGASIVLGVLEYAGIGEHLNSAFEPLTTGLLGLPAAVGVTLFFGILRKELSLVLLGAALGTENFASVLSTEQLVVFTLFVMFYVPCVSTVATLAREVGVRWAAVSVLFQTAVALLIAGAARLAFWL